MKPSFLSSLVPPQAHRVEVINAEERRYWCQRFCCTEQQLRSAIASVGHAPAAVEKHVKGLYYQP